MTLNECNNLSRADAKLMFEECCGAEKWVDALLKAMPFKEEAELIKTANHAWYSLCNEQDWLEAFSHHPKIGNQAKPGEKFAAAEQSGVQSATQKTIDELANANEAYEKKNGFIFIVCATGKPASEMLQLLHQRLQNSKIEELHIAMNEQQKITILRLKKNLSKANWGAIPISQLTTHVLDTSIGQPGKNMGIRLQKLEPGYWQTIAQGITNEDGRIADMLPALHYLNGNFKMLFDTGAYFAQKQTNCFYPVVEIQFTIAGQTHYHIPLLISPFGFTTYRES